MNNVNYNKSNLSDFDTVELLSVYLEGYILTPVAILGIIGKILLQLIVAPCFLPIHLEYYLFIKFFSSIAQALFHNIYILGNIMSIFVLCSKELRNEFSTLLTALSSFDTLYLLMAILLFGIPNLSVLYSEYILSRIMPIG